MYTKTSIAALCAAASVGEVAASHVHRQLHHKRDVAWAATDTVMVTDWVTVTATPGADAAATAQAEQFTQVYPASGSTTTTVAAVSPTTMMTSVVKSSTTAAAETSVISAPVVSDTTTPVEVPTTTAAPTTVVQVPTTSSTSTSSAAVVPTKMATVASSGTGKRGAAYNDASLVQAILDQGGDISWGYNWGYYSDELSTSIPYYPMLWSPAPEHSDGWDSAVTSAIGAGTDVILSFNEPDNPGQANMSPSDAAAAHKQYLNPYGSGSVRIASPAITSSESSGQGIDWLTQFFTACNGECQVDICAAHWYGPGGSDGANIFLEHVKAVRDACDGKPVWLTEFAPTSDSYDDFVSTVVQALESDEYSFVEKYSYFMVSQGSIMDSATELSSYGKIFAGLS
ncbi:glycosyl hydrolase catalytic core-domain-containing protein [Xylariomycetidae sp. FL0641]|nr:glycosyl hydrolase catalytic core-domain-containing protein [Xylariomycetidae sp. FL0641]